MRRHPLGGIRIAMSMAAAILALPPVAGAQPNPAGVYPNRFVKIVVPYSAGGGTDVVARVIGEKLAERLGQPVVIENKPGAGARLGTEFVATQPPDGYTLLIAGGSEMAISSADRQDQLRRAEEFHPADHRDRDAADPAGAAEPSGAIGQRAGRLGQEQSRTSPTMRPPRPASRCRPSCSSCAPARRRSRSPSRAPTKARSR